MSMPGFQSSHYGRFTRTISITSGKGGVGKTTVVTNLAYELGRRGHKVLILDGDLGMANVDIMFGVRSHRTIEDVFKGECTLREVIMEVAPNVFLIPGGSGIYGLQRLGHLQKQMLLDQVSRLEGVFDFLLIDTAPGIDDNVLYLNTAADEIVVLLTPDPSSLTDAYALIKVLNMRHHETRFSVVCNSVRDQQEALAVYKRLSDVASKFLCVSLDFKGFIPNDANLRQATKMQQLILRSGPTSPASQSIRNLSEKLCGITDLHEMKGGLQFFWRQLSGVA